MAQPKPALRAPEGKWLSKLERTCATSFSPDLAPVLSAALFGRFESRGQAEYADKLMSAMRLEFGGHHEKPAGT